MYERNSTPSPISTFPGDSDELTDDLDPEFDRAEDILGKWHKGMRPDPDLTVSEWADQHRWPTVRAAGWIAKH